jgi:hypothetical protein
MLLEPNGSVETVQVAVLPDTVPVPMVDEPLINVTVPLLIPDGVSVAVNVTGEPYDEGLGEAASVVVVVVVGVTALTTSDTVFDVLAESLVSPPNTATRLLVPCGSEDVEIVATPLPFAVTGLPITFPLPVPLA